MSGSFGGSSRRSGAVSRLRNRGLRLPQSSVVGAEVVVITAALVEVVLVMVVTMVVVVVFLEIFSGFSLSVSTLVLSGLSQYRKVEDSQYCEGLPIL